jgi:hypothetical protein
MPATVRKARKSGYNIVDKNSGKVKGHSSTKAQAQKSANARNAALHGWKPNKSGGRKR